VTEPDQRPPAEIGDEEADLAGADRRRQLGSEHVDRSDRRSRLDRRQQRVQAHLRPPTLVNHV